jgi:hypothetical protein
MEAQHEIKSLMLASQSIFGPHLPRIGVRHTPRNGDKRVGGSPHQAKRNQRHRDGKGVSLKPSARPRRRGLPVVGGSSGWPGLARKRMPLWYRSPCAWHASERGFSPLACNRIRGFSYNVPAWFLRHGCMCIFYRIRRADSTALMQGEMETFSPADDRDGAQSSHCRHWRSGAHADAAGART